MRDEGGDGREWPRGEDAAPACSSSPASSPSLCKPCKRRVSAAGSEAEPAELLLSEAVVFHLKVVKRDHLGKFHVLFIRKTLVHKLSQPRR